MRDEAFGDVPQEAKIQVTKWQGVSFAVGASCENNDADLHPVSRTRVQQQRRVARTLFGHRRRSPTIQLGAGPRRRMGELPRCGRGVRRWRREMPRRGASGHVCSVLESSNRNGQNSPTRQAGPEGRVVRWQTGPAVPDLGARDGADHQQLPDQDTGDPREQPQVSHPGAHRDRQFDLTSSWP